MASNLALTHLRRRAARPIAALTDEEPGASDPGRHVVERDAVRRALQRLTAKQRAALVLHEVYGLACDEVGQALGLSRDAVKMALFRARELSRRLSTGGCAMTTHQALCTLDLTSADLSAWRSQALPEDEYRRIAQHLPTCRACQATLAEYASLANVLRSRQVPPTGTPLWHATSTKITTYERSRMQRSQQYFIAGGLGVLAVLILSFAVILASSLGPDMSNTAPTAITQPTNTPHRTPTPDTLHVSPAQGWVSATTLPFGKSIAFARSAPLTGYACGNTATDGFTTDLLLWSITHDGGRTWSSPTQTSSRGSMCDININPSNAQDVVLHGLIVCPLDDCAVAQADPFYVSHDGGTSWQELLLPHASALQAPLVFSQIWAGNALFITGLKSSANASDYELSVSINGGPMQDLDLNKTFAGINGASLGFNSYFFATTSTFGIRAAVPGCISLATTPLCPMVTTSDHGATWQHFIPSGDAPSTFIVLGGDGQTLLGGLSQSVTTSSDGGRTWTALTSSSYPTAITDSTITLSSMPDGTLYISGFLTSAEHMAVYRFSPSTAKWQYIATAPGWQTLATSWDVNGHAVATWAQTGVIARRVLPPGIAYHAATP